MNSRAENSTYVASQLGHSPAMTLRTYAHVIDELTGAERVSAEDTIRTVREKRKARALKRSASE